jgi:hypothetical protein
MFKRGSFRTIQLTPGVEAVIGHPRDGVRASTMAQHGIPNRAGKLGWLGAPRQEDVRFFLEHSGYVGQSGSSKVKQKKQRIENAKNLARAEEYAREHGWRYDWQEEEDPDLSWLAEGDDPADHEMMAVLLRDENGEVLASLGNIDFFRYGHQRENREYARLVEAELAYEAMRNM